MHARTHTRPHTHSFMLAHISHTFSSRLPRHWWTTALPLCCTLLHLELWASCIFNRGNLHRHCVGRCVLCQWDCLSPYLHSPLRLRLLCWGHINSRPWYRRLPDDIVVIMRGDRRRKRRCLAQRHPLCELNHSPLLRLSLHLQEELFQRYFLVLSYLIYLRVASEL